MLDLGLEVPILIRSRRYADNPIMSRQFRTRLIHATSAIWFVWLVSPPPLLAAPCGDDFKLFIRTTPTHLEERVELPGYEGHEVFYLGQGVGGGKVYRVTTPDRAETFVIKDYIFGDRYDATNDVTALKIIDEVTRGTVAERTMRPVKVIDRVDDNKVKLEYAAGTDVRKLASGASAEERKKLARLFRRQLESLRRNLVRSKKIELNGVVYELQDLNIQNSTTLGFQDLVALIKAPNPYGEPIHVRFWIKPENVVMNSDGRLFIIDPR